jgi:FtsP/CotA-like multicopper oxidase with cupredoxin domain
MPRYHAVPALCLYIGGLVACKSDGSSEEYRPPPEVRSLNGVLTAALRVEYARNRLGSDQVYLRSYNAALVGPTLRARPGDTLDITLTNGLPDTGGHAHGTMTETYNEPHAFNHTNLHTHGLWTDPEGSEQQGWGDNVLLDAAPGKTLKYKIHIPIDHPPGTHWYHSHRHGSTAMQVSSGMAGMVIIEGGLDDVAEIRRAAEKVMVFQQISYDANDCAAALPQDLQGKGVGCIESYANFGVGAWQRLGRSTAINGQINPTLTARPGEVQRWRMVHAGVRETLHLAIVPEDGEGRLHPALPRTSQGRLDLKALLSKGVKFVPMHVVAEDGIAYGRVDEHNSFELQPGYRADALIKIAEPGTYRLVDLPADPLEALHPQAETLSTLARIVARLCEIMGPTVLAGRRGHVRASERGEPPRCVGSGG